MARYLFLVCALVAFAACDRGAKVYEQGAAAEKAGQLEDARWEYMSVVRNYANSEKAADAKRGYVRVSLDMAEKALAAGDTSTCEARLGEAQPHLEDAADKERFKKLMADQRGAVIAARQAGEIRDFARKIAALATDEALAKPDIAVQAAFKWDAYIVPNLNPAQRVYLHLGKVANVERREFDFGLVKRVGEGQYVFDVVTNTSNAAEEGEWYIQNTTNGWRLVCAQKKGAADCKDPWVYKTVKE